MHLLSTVLLRDSKSLLRYQSVNNFRNEQITGDCSTATEPDTYSWLVHIIYSRGLAWLPLLCSHSNSCLVSADYCGETNFALPRRMEHKYSNRK